MPPLRFVLAVHNHQPVGNFDHVIEDAFQRAYRPWLEVLLRHPGVRTCLHQPGILWQWLERRHPEYLEQVARLVSAGQLELISGGFYEPILPVIPEADRHLQLVKLGDELQRRFGVRPRGAWLAERVWEPHLAAALARAGIEYSIVDDTHFKSAGHPQQELDGYFMTEEDGQLLRLFPIRQALRYKMPFAPPEETIELLRRSADSSYESIQVHADDGEKFGIWPGTHRTCYEEGWLDTFFGLLENNADWLHTSTFADCIDHVTPRGRTYLPTASYAEMSEWALPPAAQRKLHLALEQVSAAPDGENLKIFVRGGFWRNFLARYPESNWMHKKMLYVSRKRAALNSKAPAHAVDDLLAGQCNCAYWHGLFGGLYLPHLRSAVYRHLIQAEVAFDALLSPPPTEVLDFDADGQPEIILRSERLLGIVKPSQGGGLFELDDRCRAFNLLDLMARREEAYHDKLRTLAEQDETTPAATVSIHDRVATKEAGLEQQLHVDTVRRGAFLDALLPESATLEDFAAGRLQSMAHEPYTWSLDGDSLQLVATFAGPHSIRLRKTFRLRGDSLMVDYELDADAPNRFLFGVEVAINLLAGRAHDRYYEMDGARLQAPELASAGVLDGCRSISLVDQWLGLRVRLDTSTAASLWRAPIETVSMSEAGFEKVFQGSALLFVFAVAVRPGNPWSQTLTLKSSDL